MWLTNTSAFSKLYNVNGYIIVNGNNRMTSLPRFHSLVTFKNSLTIAVRDLLRSVFGLTGQPLVEQSCVDES